MMNSNVEIIDASGKVLCYLIHENMKPDKTTFITPADARQQVGFVVYPKGGDVKRHSHQPLERHLIGMSEVLVVRSGGCTLDLYDDDHILVASRRMGPGDVAVLTAGGHGLHMEEDTVLLEVKQGPYLGADDKEMF
jgi:mannose-6-phosphate isomerase-like protein (cupin superfamily)